MADSKLYWSEYLGSITAQDESMVEVGETLILACQGSFSTPPLDLAVASQGAGNRSQI
jgi:hypothetical protein